MHFMPAKWRSIVDRVLWGGIGLVAVAAVEMIGRGGQVAMASLRNWYRSVGTKRLLYLQLPLVYLLVLAVISPLAVPPWDCKYAAMAQRKFYQWTEWTGWQWGTSFRATTQAHYELGMRTDGCAMNRSIKTECAMDLRLITTRTVCRQTLVNTGMMYRGMVGVISFNAKHGGANSGRENLGTDSCRCVIRIQLVADGDIFKMGKL